MRLHATLNFCHEDGPVTRSCAHKPSGVMQRTQCPLQDRDLSATNKNCQGRSVLDQACYTVGAGFHAIIRLGGDWTAMKESSGRMRSVVALTILIYGLTVGMAAGEKANICITDTSSRPLTPKSVDEAVVIVRATLDAVQTDGDKLLKFHTITTIKGQHRASWTVGFSLIMLPEMFDDEFSDLVGKEVIVGLATAPVDQPAEMVAGEHCGPIFYFETNIPDVISAYMAGLMAEKGLLPPDVIDNMNRRRKLIDDAQINKN